jgi:tetratricopeptide (TPR) repeat protein
MVSHGLRFHGFDFLTYNLVARLFAALRQPVEADALRMFAYLSVASGALYLAAVAWAVRSLSRDRALRVLLYGLLVFFGSIQVFMGYVECYSILTVFMLLFVASLIGHYRNRLPIWTLGVAFGLGLMFHLDAMFLAPLLILPLAWPVRHSPRSFIWRLILLTGPIVAALGVAVAILVLQGYNRNMFHYDFVLLQPGNMLFVPFKGEGGLFSWQHWKDVLNLLFLLAPVPVVMLVLSAVLTLGKRPGLGEKQKGRENSRDSVTAGRANEPDGRLIMLLLGANLWFLVLMSTLHMKQGIPRDWDLFAAHATLVVLTAWFAWSRLVSGHLRDELAGATIITAFLLSLPWFWLNAGEARSVQWFQDITPGFPPYQKAYAYEELGNYYRDTGRPSEALKQYQSSFETFPGHGRFGAALGSFQYSEGMKDEALRTFRQVLAADSTQRIALELTARIHYERGEYEATLLYARRLAKVGQERPLAAAIHGDAAETLGLFEEALASYERALRGDPSNVELMCRIGRLYVRRGDFARAEQAFESALRLQPNSVPARMGLATAVWEPVAGNRVAWNEPATQDRLKLVYGILTQLISEGKSDEETRAWQEEVRRALHGASLLSR